MKHHILLVDDDALFRKSMSMYLKDEGFIVTAIESGDEAIALVRQGIIQFSLALIDYHMPQLSGEETIKELKNCNPNLIIYAFSGDDSYEAYQKSLDSGAAFFLQKDINHKKLFGLLNKTCSEIEDRIKVLEVKEEPSEKQKLIQQINMIGVSDHMAEVARTVLKFADHGGAVLIRGENGTGKDKVANAIHKHSSRSKSAFIPVNCAAISESLIESELFGYVKGAFTGALKDKIGLFEAANGGTLFLDEIGEMPKHIQSKLLRVLQDKMIVPVGATEPRPVDFRLVAATNANLEEMIKDGRFREDLYYRLNVLPIHLKPLRERPDDIPVLIAHFLEQANLTANQNRKMLKSSVEQLKNLQWAGNVRELQQAIEFLLATSVDETIKAEPYIVKAKSNDKPKNKFSQFVGMKTVSASMEKKMMEKALLDGGSVSAASRLLEMSRTTFRDKMKKYQLILDQLT